MAVVLNVHATGISNALAELKGLRKKLDSGEISDKIVEHVKDLAVKFAPKKTGALEKSIYVEKVGRAYQLIADVPYASYVEYGTRFIGVGSVKNPLYYTSSSGKFASRPFMRPAIYRGLKDAQKIVDSIVEKIKRGR